MAGYNKEKYYWLKLRRDFFKRHDIVILESLPNGKEYCLFYLKLLVESIDHEGELRFNDTIPYNEDMLAAVTNTNIDIVRAAMGILTQMGLVEILDDETIYMRAVENMIGSQTKSAQKKELQRKGTGGGHLSTSCPPDVHLLVENCPPEIDIEIEKEIEKETVSKDTAKKEPRHKYGEYSNVLLSDSDLSKLKSEFPSDWEERIERLSAYMESTGKSYKNHLATIRNWARKNKDSPDKQSSRFSEYDAKLRVG